LRLAACRGLSDEFVQQEGVVPVGECLCGLVAQSGEVLLTGEGLLDARHTRMRELGPHAHVIVPLKSKGKVLGVMLLYPRGARRPRTWSLELLAAIGNQMGVAIENAQLYEGERRARELSQMASEHSRHYVRNITRAQEDERKRVARELHDETAQALLLLSRRIDDLTTFPGGLPEPVAEGLEQLRDTTGDILRGVRRFSRDLRPPVLDDLGLLPALEGMMAGLREADGLAVELEVIGEGRRLSPAVELVLFRIAQEALRNVQKHAQATTAVVTVEFSDAGIKITVHDDGKGFERPDTLGTLAQVGKMGLVGMRERAQLVGGTLAVRSAPDQGTAVVVEVPLDRD
jgi:two-component system sensor histidine kinase DegS